MSTPQTESSGLDPPKLHHLFKFYDPEVVAVMAILLGLFQVLLTIPTYTINTEMRYLFVCPLCVGFVSVFAGSLGMVSERIPSRQLLKICLYAGLAGLGGTLIAIFLYGYAAMNVPLFPPCNTILLHLCIEQTFEGLYKSIYWQLLFYDFAALALHCFLSFSAFKGLKTH
ncbi:uncharacterized protein si:dkey-9i23.16 [Xyrauchen texanus]|uniref:uncharacterized protein si:dkey-9i23.16 n=1 Tax=Xyrauchen texanus TaxID=154827 RepID=UPI002242974E|nr:uncharacterized protein si:dkey-9i23.16 [Xyrauchen texanus]